MATLQKFKLLATQCTVVGSPTRSPTTSPVIHIRRRKTLRMLLLGGNGVHRRFRRDESLPHPRKCSGDKPPAVRLKLKDLFISSPPPTTAIKQREEAQRLLPNTGGEVTAARGSVRPLSATLRQRLLMRRAWRPALVAIPEVSP